MVKAAVLAMLLALSAWAGHHYTVLEYEARAGKQTLKQSEVAVTAVSGYGQAQLHIQSQIAKIKEEIQHEVSVQPPESVCAVPAGVVRLLNAAASGGATPSNTDDASEEVEVGALAEVIAENYAIARENAAQLEALQQWARQAAEK